MPTYDYECEACGHKFEKRQEMSDRIMRTCPKCKKKKLIRLIGAGSGIIMKKTPDDYKEMFKKMDKKKGVIPKHEREKRERRGRKRR